MHRLCSQTFLSVGFGMGGFGFFRGMLGVFIGLDPSPDPSRQPNCTMKDEKLCQEIFLTKYQDFDQCD